MGSIDSTGLDPEKRNAGFSTPGDDVHLAGAYLNSILEHSGDIIFMMNEEGILLSFSRGGERLLGYSGKEVVGQPVQQMAYEVEAFENALQECRERGRVMVPEFSFRHRLGTPELCELCLIKIPNREKDDVVLGIGRGLHCEKKLQDDLTRVDRLAELGRSASGIAHDINNPVAVIGEISGWMEVLISDAGGLSAEERNELAKAVQDIEKQTRRCKAITRQVLNFARESHSEKQTFDLHKVLKNTVQFLRSETASKNIDISLDLMDSPPSLQSDPEKLEQVFINLLSNAIQSIDEKKEDSGKIRLSTSRIDHMVEIMISDSGTGIPEEMHHKIFELFYTTKPSGKGTGLGLPICRNIIEKLGGEISFQSEPGMGTDFFVRLPIS